MEDEHFADSNSEDDSDNTESGSESDSDSSHLDDEDSEAETIINAASNPSVLWTKGNSLDPELPDCHYKKSLFDLWDLDSSSTPFEVFRHFVNDDLIDEIRFHTNLYAQQGAFKNWKEITTNELWTFLGLHLLMGVVRKPSYKDYFATNPLLSTPMFGESLSRDRFFSILRALHFIDNNSEEAKAHRLKKLGNLLPQVSAAFKQTIQPGEFMCVDESLLLFKGRLSFLQYIPSKRARFGIKFYCLVDCETKFLVHIIPYTGKTTQIDRSLVETLGFGGATVVTMMEDYLNCHRKVVVDNFFTSPRLLDHLYVQKTYVLGTVRKNRKGMPIGIGNEKLAKGDVTVYCTGDKSVVRWKDRRDVYMLSNFIKHEMVPVQNKRKRTASDEPPAKTSKSEFTPKLKPLSVLKYNSTMGGVDDVDRQIVHYVAERKSMKWYKKVAFHLFDLCVYNAYVVHQRLAEGTRMEYKKFILDLISELLKEFKVPRSKVGRPAHCEDPGALRLNGFHVPVQVPNGLGKLMQRRCVLCSSKNLRHDTTYSCKTCLAPLCNKLRGSKSCFDLYHSIPNLPRKK